MRFNMTKFGIVIAYVMAVAAIVLFAVSFAYAFGGDVPRAVLHVAWACFLLLLSIWANVCS